MSDILQLHNVRYFYNGKKVLDVPEFTIVRGSINGLAGPNGSGKTTLLRIMSLAEKAAAGEVTYCGENGEPVKNNGRYRVTLLPQDPYLLKRSVFDNITYGLKIRGIKDNLATAVANSLQLVGLPQSFAARQWYELSGGEAQRVALAARLVLKPDCLLLDEPTASVDMESAGNIRRAIFMARKEWGTTLVIASHNKSWLNDICDRIIYIYNGRILDFPYENVITGPWTRVAGRLHSSRLADGQQFYASAPPHPDSTAAIAPGAIEIAERAPSDSEKTLHGTVAEIYFERLQTGPLIHVICGDHRFIAGADDKIFATQNIRPGRKVTLLYRPEQATWLPQ